MVVQLTAVVSAIICLVLSIQTSALSVLKDASGDVQLTLAADDQGLRIQFDRQNRTRLSGVAGTNRDFSTGNCIGFTCTFGDVSVNITTQNGLFTVTWETENTAEVFRDCFDLSDYNWYGGPERYEQKYPIEQLVLNGSEPYIIKKSDNFAVAERYWLNSAGAYIFIDDRVPLFIDQNNEEPGKICLIAKAENPYINRNRVILQYSIEIQDDPKQAHLHAVNNVLGKPKGHPNENMIRQPIWTTWAKLKRDIDDDIVLDFVNSIVSNGFQKGQIEIDEDWEVCFGAHVFKEDKFARIQETVQTIKDLGFRVTLWINPFVNDDCQNYSSIGLENGYFVKNINGSTQAIWWEGDNAHQIDFTKAEAAQWLSDRIRVLLTDPGVDGFKFDAGETDYAIPPSLYENVDPEQVPNCLTSSYIKTVAEFGDLSEVRSAWRTQELPIFVRMIDKESVWGINNGLKTLITTLLQMNLNGYTMVLPDMIGGNGYSAQPTAELIVRWAQANVFMPAMQFSYLPWDYPTDEFNATDLVRNAIDLHEQYSDEILEAMNASIENGIPVNPPIWWVDPTDEVALAIDDEYLLGENILVAPVVTEGASTRDVYLPKGYWVDANRGTILRGPLLLADYHAPIYVLPYFIRLDDPLKTY